MKKLLALLLCLVLTGCTVTEPPEDVDPGWEEYQQQEQTGGETTGNTLPREFTLAYHKDHTLDPLLCGEGIQQDVASLLYEPLFLLDERFEPQGLLCEYAEWDESRLVCTLYIRSGILFSDGSELRASDAAAALQRAMTVPRYAYRLRQIASVQYSNRNGTVTVTLHEKNEGFLALLDIPVVKKGTEEQLVPVGTGPYRFAEEADACLVRNETWWQQKRLPVDKIRLIHAKDEDTAIHLFASDRVELLTLDPTGGHGSISGSTDSAERPTARMHFIGFNTVRGVFADRAARVAFSAGIPRDVLVDAFLSDHALAAYYPVSPLSVLYPQESEMPYDPQSTLDAVSAAGYATGETRELILLVNEEDTFRRDNAEYIAETLSILDWQITLRVLPWEEYLVALEQGDFDLYYGQVRLCADWDATDLIGSAGIMNYGRYTDLQMDQYLQEFREATDRVAAAERLYAYFMEAAPIAPICFQNCIVVTHTGVVEGIRCTVGTTFASLEEWTIHLAP